MSQAQKSQPLPSAPSATKPGRDFITDAEEIKAGALKDTEFLRAVHGQGFSGVVMRSMHENIASGKLFSETCQDFQIDVLARMEARDPGADAH